MLRNYTLSLLLSLAICTVFRRCDCAAHSDADADILSEQRRRRRNLRQGVNHNRLKNAFNEDYPTDETERSLIVGGSSALHYPDSIVFLSDRTDNLSCGGSLISPTIVLAAGHCEVSLVTHAVFKRYHHSKERLGSNGLGVHSEREIRIPIKEEILHPEYDRRTLQNDVMLLVLEHSPNDLSSIESRISTEINQFRGFDTTDSQTVPYMRLHTPDDPSLDDLATRITKSRSGFSGFLSIAKSTGPKTTGLELKAMGWGHTVDGEKGKPSDTLKEATINYVVNSECSKAKENDRISYEGRITEDMMCTYASGQDTCHGDSGGPIVLVNPNPGSEGEVDFVQVGIISWGEDCADHIFPGVGSRVSSSYKWIRDRVCSIDGADAPSSFECVLGDEHTYSPAPSFSPTTSNDALEGRLRSEALSMIHEGGNLEKVDVEIEILLDVFASETSWSLTEVETGIVVIHVPPRFYQFENKATHVVQLTVGRSYQFRIKDQYGDGITNEGGYRIYTIDEDQESHVGTMLVDNSGDFRHERSHVFLVPTPEESIDPKKARYHQDDPNNRPVILSGLP